MVQLLRLCTATAGGHGLGSIPNWGTKIPYPAWHSHTHTHTHTHTDTHTHAKGQPRGEIENIKSRAGSLKRSIKLINL